MKYFPQMV